MKQFKCNTAAQYKAYQWIVKHFNTNCLSLDLFNDNTIRIIDENNESAKVTYSKNKITIQYHDGNKETFQLKKINEHCR